MSFQALNVAASSLRVQQKAIDVVSQNIANVNTPGYSRQRANIVTASPERIGGLDFGRGVSLNNIQRAVEPVISIAQRENASQFEFWNTVSSGLTIIESTFGSLDNTGLSASVNEFFLSWQQLSNNPQDTAQKYNVLNKSEALTTQLNSMYKQLESTQQSIDKDINQQIAAANLKIDEIATLSNQIRSHEVGFQSQTGTANDLRDQRDQAVRSLAKIIPIQEVTTQDGSFLIQTKSGDLLSHDGSARHLTRGSNVTATGYRTVVTEGTSAELKGLDTGGSLGGLISLRDNNFNNYMASLDDFAANLSYATNQVHSNAGGGTPASVVLSGQASTKPTIALNDPTQLVPFADKVQAGSFSIHIYDPTGSPQVPTSQFSINLAAGASMNDVATAINAGVTGATAIVDATGSLNINAGSNTVLFSDDTSNFLAAYEVNAFFHGSTAGNLAVAQDIQNNAASIHTSKVDPITSVIFSGNSAAAIEIMNLQDTALSMGTTPAASLHERIARLSTQYGLDIGIANQQKSYRASEASSLVQQREAISGVNVDEELVAMMKFQKAYEASAKVISTSNQMLDTLMGILR